jgi:hypothetical protein
MVHNEMTTTYSASHVAAVNVVYNTSKLDPLLAKSPPTRLTCIIVCLLLQSMVHNVMTTNTWRLTRCRCQRGVTPLSRATAAIPPPTRLT